MAHVLTKAEGKQVRTTTTIFKVSVYLILSNLLLFDKCAEEQCEFALRLSLYALPRFLINKLSSLPTCFMAQLIMYRVFKRLITVTHKH